MVDTVTHTYGAVQRALRSQSSSWGLRWSSRSAHLGSQRAELCLGGLQLLHSTTLASVWERKLA